ncbi:MAG: diacylglycerol kinase [Proteobacteria bacterium]|nr:diacylglycerol kinase [Pseudomonadota bacterium]
MLSFFQKLYTAFCYSFQGIKYAFRTQFAFRTEIFLTIIIVPLAALLSNSAAEIALLLSSWFLVILTELINTAIEITIDRISLERHELSGRAKDIGSAAVLIACINVVVVWGLVVFGGY